MAQEVVLRLIGSVRRVALMLVASKIFKSRLAWCIESAVHCRYLAVVLRILRFIIYTRGFKSDGVEGDCTR